MDDENRLREFTRVSAHVTAVIRYGDGAVCRAQAENISMNGVYVHAALEDQEGPLECVLEVEEPPEGPQVEIHLTVVVARHDESGTGLKIVEILGPESWQHLNNLVICNSGGSALVEHEIHGHLGIKERRHED